MSERSTSTTLQEKCCLSVEADPELNIPASQDKTEVTSNIDIEDISSDINYGSTHTRITSDCSSCDKSLNNCKNLLISRELGETDICPEELSSHSECDENKILCKTSNLSAEEARTNGLIYSFSDKVITSPSLPQSDDKLSLQTNKINKSSHSASSKSFIDNLPTDICKLETTVNKYKFNKNNSNENFETKLKKVSKEEIDSKKYCEDNNDPKATGKENSEDDHEVDENLPQSSSSASPEHESDIHGLCDNIDEIYHVPKKPIFNGNMPVGRRSNLKRKATDSGNEEGAKRRRTIQFEGVTVFYFPRSQGFTCVPSQGGSTLGMSRRHFSIRSFSLSEHASEQRRSHRDYLLRLRQQRNNQERKETGSQCSSSEESEENSEEASDVSDSELESDSFFFLQPLPIRQRRALLRQSGIRQIEGLEKDECKDIRISREMCGCQCKVYCDPSTCQCSQAGIKCQVDRHSFPCGCSRDGCSNPNGRIEFNPIRVRTHFLHTLMRLEIEKCQNQHPHWGIQQQQQQQQINEGLEVAKAVTTSASSSTWLQTNNNSCANSFVSSSGNSMGNSLPFFTSQEPGALMMNQPQEMHPCSVGSSALYSPFEVRQADNNTLPTNSNNSVFQHGSGPTKTEANHGESKDQNLVNGILSSHADVSSFNEINKPSIIEPSLEENTCLEEVTNSLPRANSDGQKSSTSGSETRSINYQKSSLENESSLKFCKKNELTSEDLKNEVNGILHSDNKINENIHILFEEDKNLLCGRTFEEKVHREKDFDLQSHLLNDLSQTTDFNISEKSLTLSSTDINQQEQNCNNVTDTINLDDISSENVTDTSKMDLSDTEKVIVNINNQDDGGSRTYIRSESQKPKDDNSLDKTTPVNEPTANFNKTLDGTNSSLSLIEKCDQNSFQTVDIQDKQSTKTEASNAEVIINASDNCVGENQTGLLNGKSQIPISCDNDKNDNGNSIIENT